MAEDEAPQVKLKLRSCGDIEKIIDAAAEFFVTPDGKPVDALLVNAYIMGAAQIQAARMIVESNNALAFALNHMAQAIGKSDVPGV
ncbi:MAG TPA: hypothetical protein VH621_05360 [Nitrososphaera sp.]